MKILYFIGNLSSGGKQRRLIELMARLKDNPDFEILLVLAFNQIDYNYFYDLGIEYISIDKTSNRKSLRPFFRLNSIVKKFLPDIIHTWGNMQTFYMAPIAFVKRKPLINSQITDAPPKIRKFSFQNFVNKFNFIFSDIILANSHAGVKAYKVDKLAKSKVIHNGFDFKIAGKENFVDIDNKTKEYINKLHSLENDEFVGFLCRKKLLEFLNNAKFLLSTSRFEDFSNTFLEAMSCGTPIITTENANPDTVISKYDLGFIYTNQNDFSEKYDLITPESYAKISNNTLEYISKHHNYKVLAVKLSKSLNND